MECFWNIGEMFYGMNEDGWWDMMYMKWMMKWNGFSLWNGVEEYKNCPAIHDICYSFAARLQTLNSTPTLLTKVLNKILNMSLGYKRVNKIKCVNELKLIINWEGNSSYQKSQRNCLHNSKVVDLS